MRPGAGLVFAQHQICCKRRDVARHNILEYLLRRQALDKMKPNKSDICYRIDENDAIRFVDDAWNRFASDHGANELASSLILSRSIWDFIGGLTTIEIYRDLLTTVRSGRAVRFTFRCDTPELKRVLEMNMAEVGQRSVEFRTRVLLEQPHPIEAALERMTFPARQMTICSWCKRVEIEKQWAEPGAAVARLGLFEWPSLPNLVHGICDD